MRRRTTTRSGARSGARCRIGVVAVVLAGWSVTGCSAIGSPRSAGVTVAPSPSATSPASPARPPSPNPPVASASLARGPGSTEEGRAAVSTPLRTVAPTARPLTGKVVVIDPGHNGGNARAAARIARPVWIGNGRKACDTSGAQTAGGYPESAFTWDVAVRLAAQLRRAGATVVLTRPSDTGVGPCITERAAIGNRAHADAAISLHADGAAPSGYGFHVIEPASIGRNAAIVAPSARLAVAVRAAFATTGERFSTYTGGGRALTSRTDLGGLNLSSVPKVFIECLNLRNAADARRASDPAWRLRAATALAAGITAYLQPAGG